jgi:L,D-transpeptidase-like protein
MITVMLIGLLMGGPVPAPAGPSTTVASEAVALYREMRLEGVLDEVVFTAAHERVQRHGARARMVAIADMSQPSTAKRLYVFDFENKKLVLRTWVAHGSGSGGLMAERFGNSDGSHQTSLGLYRVGARIVSPKHGAALLLDGLDRGVNDKARSREVIIHAAPYVSAAFVASQGRLGRSWGCPAVSAADMPKLIDLLRDGGLLYVYGA